MNTSEKDKALMWYFSPSQIIRLMRTRIFENIEDVEINPKYDLKTLKVGIVINAINCPAIMDLQLYYLKNINKIENIFIYDNLLNNKELEKIYKSYNVNVYQPTKKMWEKEGIGSIASQDCIFNGLIWGKNNNLDIIVKLSSLLIPCCNWLNNFKQYIVDTNGITFSSYCKESFLPFRTDCFAMNVNAWNNNVIMNQLHWTIQNEFPIFEEFWFDYISKMLDDKNKSEKYLKLKEKFKNDYVHSGYVHWYELLGTSLKTNKNRLKEVLWNKFSNENDYYNKVKEVFNNKYTIEDFNEVLK